MAGQREIGVASQRGRPASRLIAAIDTVDPTKAGMLAAALGPHCGLLKVGLALFTAAGPHAVSAIGAHAPVFLDLKLHDIPNTVADAVRALMPLRPAMLTLHATGGAAMLSAARDAAEAAPGPRPLLLGVTVLTSLDARTLRDIGMVDDPVTQAVRLGRMAMRSGADGLVCSPLEVAALRGALGPTPKIVVPGVRPAGMPAGDQRRTATPAEAIAAGADWIVIGRPITGAEDPAAAAAAIAATLP